MQNKTIKIIQSIAMVLLFAMVIAGSLLFGANRYIDYVGGQIKERQILAQELQDHMEDKSEASNNYEAILADFKANNPSINESAAYWIHKLVSLESKKDTDKSNQVYKAAIERLEPNELRLFLKVTKIMPQNKSPEYFYENASGAKVNLKDCHDELEGNFQDLMAGVEKEGTLIASVQLMNYFMFPNVFTETCSQLRAVKKE